MSEAAMSGAAANVFVAGFAPRQDDAAVRLQRVFAERPAGFAPGDLIARIEEAFSASSQPHGMPVPEPEAAAQPPAMDPVAAAMAEVSAIDPLVEAHQAGFDAGYAAARAEYEASAARDLALIEGIAAALKSDERIDRERIARQLRQTVLHLVGGLIGQTGIAGDLLAGRVEAAAELLADQAESAILRVNPEDVGLLHGRLPDTIFAVGDATLARGSFVLEAASTIVEDGPDLWLEQLTSALDKVAVPAL
ncbi:flagellar biosynthesis protein FliH [Sphingomonas sp. IC-11]|uniref:FliH/SctL family protein n=1 Tax=Sphingomonas sp. IC-11 TaxID=2898528 RepID=UPI001E543883|nr:FliH/SctL family protein [Sphingomonas sp. IC-11]MCD2314767.1 flagellar biosynthesis protein FliH [Sphingomonas sp. IC-11]